MSVLTKTRCGESASGTAVPEQGGERSPRCSRALRRVEVRLKKVNAHLVSLLSPGSPEAERYRGLRHSIEQLHRPGEATVVGVSSPVPGDGKSVTAINLAGALAQDPNARVILVEADLRRPSLTVGDYLAMGKIKGPGLVDAANGSSLELNDVVRRIEDFNLDVLPAGRRPDAPYEVLKSRRLNQLMNAARENYDYLIVDAPPVVPVPDCRLIASWVDGFLLVVAAHRTPRAMLEEALNLMAPEKVLGFVFNGDDSRMSRKYGYYGYGYDTPASFSQVYWRKRAAG